MAFFYTNSIQNNSINYKFNEDKILDEIKKYVDATYGEHYSTEKFQTTEIIEQLGDGIGFTRGNMIKYLTRLGKKDGWNRKDLLKVMHYGILLLHFSENKEKQNYTLGPITLKDMNEK